MRPKRINLEKVGPNHEFPMILMQTPRMESWQERGVMTQLAGHSSLNLEGRNQSRIEPDNITGLSLPK